MKSLKKIIAALFVGVLLSGSISAQIAKDGGEAKVRLDKEQVSNECEAVHAEIIQARKSANAIQFFAPQLQDGHSYVWSFGDGIKSGAQNPLHEYKKSGRYIVSLVVITSCGLASTSQSLVLILPGALEDSMR